MISYAENDFEREQLDTLQEIGIREKSFSEDQAHDLNV